MWFVVLTGTYFRASYSEPGMQQHGGIKEVIQLMPSIPVIQLNRALNSSSQKKHTCFNNNCITSCPCTTNGRDLESLRHPHTCIVMSCINDSLLRNTIHILAIYF